MNDIARFVFGGFLLLGVLQTHAQSKIGDGTVASAEIVVPAAADGSFAAALKSPLLPGSVTGLTSAGWHERSPAQMLLMANPPEILRDMISPIAAGGAINGFGARAASAGVSPVPEPSTYALLLAGLSAVGVMARRRIRR